MELPQPAVEEETFIQSGRRGRDGKPGQKGRMWGKVATGPQLEGQSARQWLVKWEVPNLTADKPGGTTRE